jgi:hypothetical protein
MLQQNGAAPNVTLQNVVTHEMTFSIMQRHKKRVSSNTLCVLHKKWTYFLSFSEIFLIKYLLSYKIQKRTKTNVLEITCKKSRLQESFSFKKEPNSSGPK